MKFLVSLAMILVFILILIFYFDWRKGVFDRAEKSNLPKADLVVETPRVPAPIAATPEIRTTVVEAAAQTTEKVTQPGPVEVSDAIHQIAERDIKVVEFSPDKMTQSQGLFYDENTYTKPPITPKYDGTNRILRLDVDTGLEYCGWWRKMADEDWSKYKDYDLALRVRFSEQMFRRFKVELKQGSGPASGSAAKLEYIVDLSNEEVAGLRQQGFGDILIHLRDGVGSGTLKNLAELVLVFEAHRVVTAEGKARKGELSLHSIRLVAPKAKTR